MPDRDSPSGRMHWMTGSFIAAAGLMAVSILFVRPATGWLAKQYTKQPAEIRRPLSQFDVSAMPSFRQGWKVSLYEAPVEDIGTSEYIHAGLTGQDSATSGQPNLFVTYYNNPRDTVPHTPDVCGRQAGFIVKQMTTTPIATPQLGPRHPSVTAVQILMEDEKSDMVNLYLFVAEGEFLNSRNQVRLQIARPGHRQTYFSKVEVAIYIHRGEDPSPAIELGKRLVSEALPVLLTDHFPTDEQLQQYP